MISRASFGWFDTMRRWVFLSHQRKPGIPSLFPWRTPAWLADVCVGSSGSQRSTVISPEPSHRARLVFKDRTRESIDLNQDDAPLSADVARAVPGRELADERAEERIVVAGR